MSKPSHYDTILSAAAVMFHKRGFHGCGTQDIVTRAGASKGAFYNHFKSKEALGLAVLDHYWESHQPALQVLRAPHGTPLERIEAYYGSAAYDESGCLIGNFSAELSGMEEFRVRLSTIFGLWVAELASCIAEGQADGTIRDDEDATALAEFVTISYEGAILKAKVDRDPDVLKRFSHFVQSFLRPG